MGFLLEIWWGTGRTLKHHAVFTHMQLLLYLFRAKDFDCILLLCLALDIHCQIDVSKGSSPQQLDQLELVYLFKAVDGDRGLG